VALRSPLRLGVAATMLGGPWMGVVGMSLGKQIGPEFQAFDFTHARLACSSEDHRSTR